jgi:hypothetical protein
MLSSPSWPRRTVRGGRPAIPGLSAYQVMIADEDQERRDIAGAGWRNYLRGESTEDYLLGESTGYMFPGSRRRERRCASEAAPARTLSDPHFSWREHQ